MSRVVVAEVFLSPERTLDIERAILEPEFMLDYYPHSGTEDELVAACQGADAILTDYASFSRSALEQLPHCRLISVAATGFDSIDLPAARDLGISVCAIDEYCTNEVADHAMLLILASCRRLTEYHEQIQQHEQWQFDSLAGLKRLNGMTLGLIGFGRIGQALAHRATAFGMTVIAHDPFADSNIAAKAGVRLCDLEALYARADVVSLHCGLDDSNRHLINRDAFEKMQNKPVLINCARGGLIDERALVEALDNGQISAAGLDVLESETPELGSSPLRGRSNVLLTPHVAFYSDAAMRDNRRISAENIQNALQGDHASVRRYIYKADD